MRTTIALLCLATMVACATDDDPSLQAGLPLGAAGACEACTNDRDCGAGLACDHRIGKWVCKSPSQMDDSKPACDVDCSYCTSHGLCYAREGKCVALTNADCAGTATCISDGRCTAIDGSCKATTEAECQKSDLCTKAPFPRCKLDPEGYCVK